MAGVMIAILLQQITVTKATGTVELTFGQFCQTDVHALEVNPHLRGQVAVSLVTNDWSLIEGNSLLIDPTNSSDCFPNQIPVLAKRCFAGSDSSCGEWTKIFATQIYQKNLYESNKVYDTFESIRALVFNELNYAAGSTVTSQDRGSTMFALIDRTIPTGWSSTTRNTYLILLNFETGEIIGSNIMYLPYDSYFFQKLVNKPIISIPYPDVFSKDDHLNNMYNRLLFAEGKSWNLVLHKM